MEYRSAFLIKLRIKWAYTQFLWLAPFQCLRRFYGLKPVSMFLVVRDGFYGFAVSSLAYAELKVNFVEGFAVLCLRRFNASRF